MITSRLQSETDPGRLRKLNAMKMRHACMSMFVFSESLSEAEDYEASRYILQSISTLLTNQSRGLEDTYDC